MNIRAELSSVLPSAELTSGCGSSSFVSCNFHRNKPQSIIIYFYKLVRASSSYFIEWEIWFVLLKLICLITRSRVEQSQAFICVRNYIFSYWQRVDWFCQTPIIQINVHTGYVSFKMRGWTIKIPPIPYIIAYYFPCSLHCNYSPVVEVYRYFAWVKILIPYCKYTLLHWKCHLSKSM